MSLHLIHKAVLLVNSVRSSSVRTSASSILNVRLSLSGMHQTRSPCPFQIRHSSKITAPAYNWSFPFFLPSRILHVWGLPQRPLFCFHVCVPYVGICMHIHWSNDLFKLRWAMLLFFLTISVCRCINSASLFQSPSYSVSLFLGSFSVAVRILLTGHFYFLLSSYLFFLIPVHSKPYCSSEYIDSDFGFPFVSVVE